MDKMWSFVFLALWLGALSVVDLRWKRVPMWLLAAGGALMTMVSVVGHAEGVRRGPEMIWGLLPGTVLLLVALTTKKAGVADGVVLLLLGLWLDYRECAASFVLSLFIMSLVSLLLLVLHKVKRNSKLPYLPFLWMGCMAQALAGFGG